MASKPSSAGSLTGQTCALAHLRVLRAARGLTLDEAAKKSGMAPSYLHKLERCQIKSPSPHKLERLAETLHVDYSWLMELAGYRVDATGDGGGPTPPQYDCIAILERAARSAGIDEREAKMLADVIHELSEAKTAGLNIKHDLLPRVVRSLRELHVQGLSPDTIDQALVPAPNGRARPAAARN